MRNSRKFLWGALGLIVLGLVSFIIAGRAAMSWHTISGSSEEQRESSRGSRNAGRAGETSFSREASDFDRILVEGEWTVDVFPADDFSVEISHPENLEGHVSAVVDGDTLVLSCDIPDCSDSGLEAYVGMPALAGLSVDGAADIGFSGFHEESMEIDIQGAANVIAEDSSVERVDVSIEGAGRMDLSGIQAVNARIDLGGAGWVKLTMDGGVLEGSLDGVGRILYSGEVADERIRIDGLGKVIRR